MVDMERVLKAPPRVRERYLDRVRAIPPGRKIEMALECMDRARAAEADEIRASSPGITDEEVRRELIRRSLPEDLRLKVYGW
jgi:hypothetical protein